MYRRVYDDSFNLEGLNAQMFQATECLTSPIVRQEKTCICSQIGTVAFSLLVRFLFSKVRHKAEYYTAVPLRA